MVSKHPAVGPGVGHEDSGHQGGGREGGGGDAGAAGTAELIGRRSR